MGVNRVEAGIDPAFFAWKIKNGTAKGRNIPDGGTTVDSGPDHSNPH